MMPEHTPDYYLVLEPTEGYDQALTEIYGHDIVEPRACFVIKRLHHRSGTPDVPQVAPGAGDDEYWLIAIDPPFGYDAMQIDSLVVSPRWRGVSIAPDAPWHSTVKPARPARPLVADLVHREEFDPLSDTQSLAGSVALFRERNDAEADAHQFRFDLPDRGFDH
jgi:hypothetical protein